MIKLHDLVPPQGSNRDRRRVGRGIAGKGGKTAGRGTKGQGARDTIPAGFEGGQLPLTQRVPKLRGFKNPFRVEYVPINLSLLSDLAEEGNSAITLELLRGKGIVAKKELVKILGKGTISKSLRVEAHAFSKSAVQAIEAAGGTVISVPMPFGNGRPPVRGNALANR
jgi:large subunit ribosomal protein L15